MVNVQYDFIAVHTGIGVIDVYEGIRSDFHQQQNSAN